MACAAEPATYLTAPGGYYIAYGEIIPFDRSIYFLAYFVIAGMPGIAFKLFYNLTAGNKEAAQKQKLSEAIDLLPDIIHQARDLRLENLSEETRKVEAAGMLLSKLNLGPEWISAAVDDLTEDSRPARPRK